MLYRLLYPLRTYLIVSGRIGDEINVMAADWVTIVSVEPFLVAVSIAPTRYSFKLIKKYGEFVISVPSIHMLNDVWISGTEHGPEKIKKTKLEFIPASKIKTPIIGNALANLECKVVGEHKYGDHVLFIGEVVAHHKKEEAYRDNEPKIEVGFLAHIALERFTTFSKEVYTPSI